MLNYTKITRATRVSVPCLKTTRRLVHQSRLFSSTPVENEPTESELRFYISSLNRTPTIPPTTSLTSLFLNQLNRCTSQEVCLQSSSFLNQSLADCHWARCFQTQVDSRCRSNRLLQAHLSNNRTCRLYHSSPLHPLHVTRHSQ